MAAPSGSILSRLAHSHPGVLKGTTTTPAAAFLMTDLRTVVKLIRYTPDECAAVSAHARACGLPVARYVRETSLGVIPRVRRSHTNAELIRQLASIGNNLNQLAHVANATGDLPAYTLLSESVQQVLRCIRHLDQFTKR